MEHEGDIIYTTFMYENKIASEPFFLALLLNCDPVLEAILSYLRFDELTLKNKKFELFYSGSKKKIETGSVDKLWAAIRCKLNVTQRRITAELDIYDSIDPPLFMFNLHNVNPLLITEFSLDLSSMFSDWNCPYASYHYNFKPMINLKILTLDCVMLDFLEFSTSNLLVLKIVNLVMNGTFGRYAGTVYFTEAISEFFANLPLLQELYIDNIPHLPGLTALSPCLRIVHMYANNSDVHTVREFLALHAYSLTDIRITMNGTTLMNLVNGFALYQVTLPKVTHLSFSFDDFTFRKYENRSNLFLHNSVFPVLNRLTFSIRNKVTNFPLLASLTQYPNIKTVMFRPDTKKVVDFELNNIFVLNNEFLYKLASLNTAYCQYYYINVEINEKIDERMAIRKLMLNPYKRNDYWSN